MSQVRFKGVRMSFAVGWGAVLSYLCKTVKTSTDDELDNPNNNRYDD